MDLKPLRYAVTAASLLILSGCATQPEANDTTGIPKALLEAAERASHARMVYADLQARLNNHTVESVRLDPADTSVPDFMRQRVRLDYNGPMDQVLSRVANDIGYRVNEYSKPASGAGWTPWMRANGDKPLIDHLRELNSQVPWHIVLDHRNKRLVVDYSDDAGMASQIRAAHEADDKYREADAERDANMPTTAVLREEGDRAARESVQQTSSMTPETADASPKKYQQSQDEDSDDQWYAAISGYSTRADAQAMVGWLLDGDALEVKIAEVGGNYDVRVMASSNAEAIKIRDELDELGVPAKVGAIGKPSESQTSSARQSASDSSQDSQRQRNSASRQSQQPSATPTEHARSLRLDALDKAAFTSKWNVQIAFGSNMDAFGRHAQSLERMGFDVVLLHKQGNNYQLRVGPFDNRDRMSAGLGKIKRNGFSNAFPVAPVRS